MKLYHYVHCPFCVRVRMALGHLNIPFESVVLPYNDEKTPLELTGVKMLPIMEIDGKPMNESLDIIAKLDTDNKLAIKETMANLGELEDLTNRIGKDVHSMAMPYWIWTPEFDQKSRSYFQTKKEVKRGPFKNLVHKQAEFKKGLNETLTGLEDKLTPFYNSTKLTLADIILASHLWGMYVVPEFKFSGKVHKYLQTVKSECQFNYHQDFWS